MRILLKMGGFLILSSIAMFLFVPTSKAQGTEEEEKGSHISYREGLHIDSVDGRNTLHLSGRVQVLYTSTILDRASDTHSFSIRRGKIKLTGNVFSKQLQYAFQLNLATRRAATTTAVCTNDACTTTTNAVTSESESGLAELEDYYLDWIPYPEIGIRAGQFKVPFWLQGITSSGNLQLVDRSLASDFFDLKRDLGVNFHGKLFDHRLHYEVYLMNGDGANAINRNQSFLTGMRLEAPFFGHYKTSESDVSYSDDVDAGAGVAYLLNERVSSIQGGTVGGGIRASHATADAGVKYRGWSFQGAGVYTRTHEGPAVANWGYHAQAGYFLIPRQFEIAARHAGVFFSGANNQFEYAGGLNYFFNQHALKLQTDYTLLINQSGGGRKDHRVRVQAQVVF